MRFAWWGAEEAGLRRVDFYVEKPDAGEQEEITLYLNFDMIGSPNYMFGVYDGDDSAAGGPVPARPAPRRSRTLFEAFFAARGQPTSGADFNGRSDYGPFIAVGIPAGGLFTGAEGIKTAEEAAKYGGVAGLAFDPATTRPATASTPCGTVADKDVYRQLNKRCSLYGNINRTAMDINSDAVAAAVMTFALNTSAVEAEQEAAAAARVAAAGLRPLSWLRQPDIAWSGAPVERAAPVR